MVQFGVYGFLKKNLERIPDPFFETSPPKVAATMFSNKSGIELKGYRETTPIEQANVPTTGHK